MTNDPAATPSDIVGERIREIRRRRRLKVPELAAACAEAGHPELTEQTIYNIESGRRVDGRRRRTVSVDELLAFAEVFDVSLSVLLWPILRPAVQGTTLQFDSPEELADFMRLVNKLMGQAGALPPAELGGT